MSVLYFHEKKPNPKQNTCNGKAKLVSASQFLLKSGHGLFGTILKQFKISEPSKLGSVKTPSYLTFNTILLFSSVFSAKKV